LPINVRQYASSELPPIGYLGQVSELNPLTLHQSSTISKKCGQETFRKEAPMALVLSMGIPCRVRTEFENCPKYPIGGSSEDAYWRTLIGNMVSPSGYV